MKKTSHAPKTRRPSWKMASVANETLLGILNEIFEIESPYIYFLKTQTTTSIILLSFRNTFVIIIIAKSVILKLFIASL